MKQIFRQPRLIRFSYLLLLVAVLWSCGKKDSASPEYYIRYKADGVEKTYMDNPFGDLSIEDDDFYKGVYSLSLYGDNGSFAMGLYSATPINSSSVFRAGQGVEGHPYLLGSISMENVLTEGALIHAMYGGWFDMNPEFYRPEFTVSIKAINNQTVRGTFEGVVLGSYRGNHFDYFPVRITDGEFYVPIRPFVMPVATGAPR